jgi:hypothetical protein
MSIRTLLPRYPADPVWFAEKFLIDPDTAKPFEFTDHERELLRCPPFADFDARLTYLNEELENRKTDLAPIYLITILVFFRAKKPEISSGSCERINRKFEAMRRIVESSPLLLNEARISPDRIMIAGSTVIDHNRIYADIEG